MLKCSINRDGLEADLFKNPIKMIIFI